MTNVSTSSQEVVVNKLPLEPKERHGWILWSALGASQFILNTYFVYFTNETPRTGLWSEIIVFFQGWIPSVSGWTSIAEEFEGSIFAHAIPAIYVSSLFLSVLGFFVSLMCFAYRAAERRPKFYNSKRFYIHIFADGIFIFFLFFHSYREVGYYRLFGDIIFNTFAGLNFLSLTFFLFMDLLARQLYTYGKYLTVSLKPSAK